MGRARLHEPERAPVVRELLEAEGFGVTVMNDRLGAPDVGGFDLVCRRSPAASSTQFDPPQAAIAPAPASPASTTNGDAFPEQHAVRFMASVAFASHPGDIIAYRVDPARPDDPVMAGIESFSTSPSNITCVDPAVTEVLATTTFNGAHAEWRHGVVMPQVVKTSYGKARVFYSALGHRAAELEKPEIRTILKRGLLWAAR